MYPIEDLTVFFKPVHQSINRRESKAHPSSKAPFLSYSHTTRISSVRKTFSYCSPGHHSYKRDAIKLNPFFFFASHGQFYHHHLNQRQFQLSGGSRELQQHLRCFSGPGGMARRAGLLQEHRRHCGSGSLIGLVLMENCPALHLPMENPVPAPLFPILCVTKAAPLEITLQGMVLLQRGRSKEASAKGAARGDICTHQAGTRDKAGTGTETRLSKKMHGHSHHLVCILLPGQVPALGNCPLDLCLKPWQ